MAITTYAELQTALGDWLNRADLDQKIPDFIRLAESTLNDVLRSADMVTQSTSIAITSGRATLPADALEIVYAQVASSEDEPLEQITPQQLTMLRRTRTRNAANPRFYAIVGRDIVVTPTPASGSLDLDYYQRLPVLSDSNTTNWLLTDSPHIYLYTSLLHATPFLMDDARYAVFNNTVSQQVMAAVRSQQTLALDDMKMAGFSLSAPTDVAAAQQSALASVAG
tara:strand:+ start:7546 stop:8217 length:672 start_codon:yes stop_codon:yes gene_type:complete